MFGQMCMAFGWCAGIVIVGMYVMVNFINDKKDPAWWAVAATVVLTAAFVFSGIHFFATWVEWMETVHRDF